MFVLVADVELHIPSAQNLKAKRSVVLSIVRNLDQMHAVACAEVDFLDKWQRTRLGVTTIGESASQAESLMEAVERYVWSRPEVEVIGFEQSWWEED